MSRIVVEEPCEHGKYRHHQAHYCPHVDTRAHDDCPGPFRCSGGTRTVLDGIPEDWVERMAEELARAGGFVFTAARPTIQGIWRDEARVLLESVLHGEKV